MYSERDYKH